MSVPDDTRARGHRRLILLASLLFFFVVSPLLVTLHYGPFLLNLAGAAILLAGSYALIERRRLFLFTAMMAAISIVCSLLLSAFPNLGTAFAAQGTVLVLIGLFAVAILGDVLRPGRVTAEKIYGAISVYLLFGYGWAFGYALLEEWHPGSFTMSVANNLNEYVDRVMQMRYFSFATLTTLGYGDIIPRSDMARTFATLEAVMGQLYLAVLVARLVGLHIVHGDSSPK